MSKKRSRLPGMRRKPKRSSERPSWEVTLVGTGLGCDEPGCTHDHSQDDPADAFGYTVGLHQGHRLPELHLAARPDDDSGRHLTALQMGEVLNRLADGVAARKYRAGETVVVQDVQGFGEVVCRLGDPVDVVEVEAFGARPDAAVIPITWNTHRPHQKEIAIVLGSLDSRIVGVAFDAEEPATPPFGGYTLFTEGLGRQLTKDDVQSVCLHCLIEQHPEVGPGLDLARLHGDAHWNGEQWVAGLRVEGAA